MDRSFERIKALINSKQKTITQDILFSPCDTVLIKLTLRKEITIMGRRNGNKIDYRPKKPNFQ